MRWLFGEAASSPPGCYPKFRGERCLRQRTRCVLPDMTAMISVHIVYDVDMSNMLICVLCEALTSHTWYKHKHKPSTNHMLNKQHKRIQVNHILKTFIYIYIYINVCVYIYIYIHTHYCVLSIRYYTNIYIYIYICIHTYIHTCITWPSRGGARRQAERRRGVLRRARARWPYRKGICCCICYCICYCKGISRISHEVVCSCIHSKDDQLRSHFERCWNPLPWDPLTLAQVTARRSVRSCICMAHYKYMALAKKTLED